MRKAALTAGAVLLLAGCGGSASASPPSARALMARMGCQYLTQGDFFAGYDLKQDVRIQGTAPGCLAGEIFTFPSSKAQADWLHQVAANTRSQGSAIYPWFAVGNLWAVELGASSVVAQVARELHGRPVTF